jgi:hypothetical protein
VKSRVLDPGVRRLRNRRYQPREGGWAAGRPNLPALGSFRFNQTRFPPFHGTLRQSQTMKPANIKSNHSMPIAHLSSCLTAATGSRTLLEPGALSPLQTGPIHGWAGANLPWPAPRNTRSTRKTPSRNRSLPQPNNTNLRRPAHGLAHTSVPASTWHFDHSQRARSSACSEVGPGKPSCAATIPRSARRWQKATYSA